MALIISCHFLSRRTSSLLSQRCYLGYRSCNVIVQLYLQPHTDHGSRAHLMTGPARFLGYRSLLRADCGFYSSYLRNQISMYTSDSSKTVTSTKTTSSEELPETSGKKELEPSPGNSGQPEQKDSIFQRFKKAYKEHGKVLIGVHLVTSAVWFISFYYAASLGFDIVPWLEKLGCSETVIKPFRSSGLGIVAVAYLMYKLATPARYTVTLGGTNLMIRYLRKKGKIQPVPKGDSLRELYKDGRKELKERKGEIVLKLRQARLERVKKLRSMKAKAASQIRQSKKSVRKGNGNGKL
ncbi:hypothetical protein CHS0354_018920 [Potamilus streckersoni]|uniref:DUF1279 domain-containing protein n=1 Tax=Potamilus streckersoni TaxID=2493646 RepID=A0AAE0RMU6_9BIVA|nr:hypothetical protein CHS0354_018920 [Potamilus streckersoni]